MWALGRYRAVSLYGSSYDGPNLMTTAKLVNRFRLVWAGTHIGKCLMATLMITDMRFFSGMCAGMNSQRAALNEALIAVLDGAMIGSLIGMYSIMPTEIGFAIERLPP